MTAPPAAPRWRRLIPAIAIGALAVGLNVIAYAFLPPDLTRRMGRFGYFGVFIITLIANATVVVPVPYYGLVARLAQSLSLPGVVLAGALGSALGESVAFFVGKSGEHALEDTRFYRWVQRQLRHPLRAWIALFLLAAPPNPAFDVAGLTAGAMGLPFWMFFSAVFCGRIIRVGLIALAGIGLLAR